MEKMDLHLEGYDTLEKDVGDGKFSGRVYVPKSWIGKKVKIILLEDIKSPELPSTS